MKAYGLPLPASALATSEAEAIKIAKKIGYPVVMKIASPQIIHKSDAGGVKVNLTNDAEVKDLPLRQLLKMQKVTTRKPKSKVS